MAENVIRHYLSEFDAALDSFRNHVLMMGSLTVRNFEHARIGLFERDDDQCNTAIADDEEIDALETQMDRDGMSLLTRFAPIASDLRIVIATMKLSVNLERLSDLAVNIARRARKLIAYPPVAETAEMTPLFQRVSVMLADAIAAFSMGDLALAQSLKARDLEFRALSRDFIATVTRRMSFEVGDGMQVYLEHIFILRYLEQIANLATNLGEDAILAFSKEMRLAAE